MTGDTIFALASAGGRAGVAVYRLSGPMAPTCLLSLGATHLPVPRQATRLRLSHGGDDLDDGLVLYFPAPRSFTGEDVVELHLHGGRAIAAAIAQCLIELGLRPAEPGEFSKRAFLAGKLDLTQAEAIADLVDAETVQQRRQALRQLDGGLGHLVEGWRGHLVHALALVEAAIDFSDEGIPDAVVDQARHLAQTVWQQMGPHLTAGRHGERLRDGLHVAIVGVPNAGKSSLLNRLAGREAAIVSAQAGTTRDIIEIHMDLGGWPIILADTAGLRHEAGEIEAEGIRRALARAAQADLTLLVFDGTTLPHLDGQTLGMMDDKALLVLNKIDLWPMDAQAGLAQLAHLDVCAKVAVSAHSGQGIQDLLDMITAQASRILDGGQAATLTRGRHIQAVMAARTALERFLKQSEIDLAAEDLRQAAHDLGRITGRVELDEILDVVFREFCIGK